MGDGAPGEEGVSLRMRIGTSSNILRLFLLKLSLNAAIKNKQELVLFSAFFSPFTFKGNWCPFSFLLSIQFPISHLFSGYLVFWDQSSVLSSLSPMVPPPLLKLFACHFPRIKEVKLINIYFRRKEKRKKKTLLGY